MPVMMEPQKEPLLQDLLLLGGGHSHVEVLRRFAMQPLKGLRLTLVSTQSQSPYSGMLPGLLAGEYSHDEAHIDLRRLATLAGADFIRAEAEALDLDSNRVKLAGRPALSYDLLSINVGSTPLVNGDGLPVKPVAEFLQSLPNDKTEPLAIIGAGAGGVEMAFALRRRGFAQVTLVEAGSQILPSFPADFRRRAEAALLKASIEVRLKSRVEHVEDDQIHFAQGGSLRAKIIWVSGAKPPAWLAQSGLACDAKGFGVVTPSLRSSSHPLVYLAGDCAAMPWAERPKAGVFAVRQGPILAANLRAHFLGQRQRSYRPQRAFLTLLTSTPGKAIGGRGPLAFEGPWVWRWKDRIDRQFMDRYNELALGAMGPADRLPGLREAETARGERCRGCGAKLPSDPLREALGTLGVEQGDDAALVDATPGFRLVQSVDHIPPLVDDPYLAARIAAEHALNDLYAMGAKPVSAQAMVTLPEVSESLAKRLLYQVAAGFQDVLQDQGLRLTGGHSGLGPALSLGLAVTGEVAPGHERRKTGLRVGDSLLLTKPLGSGVLFAAAMKGAAAPQWLDDAVEQMLQSNAAASKILCDHEATAMTDISGFGLGGHLMEMLAGGAVRAVLSASDLPALSGSLKAFAAGLESSLGPANRSLLGSGIHDPLIQMRLADPQTAGGLLAGIPSERAKSCLRALREAGYASAATVGRIVAKEEQSELLATS